jgi:hypothetical protein
MAILELRNYKCVEELCAITGAGTVGLNHGDGSIPDPKPGSGKERRSARFPSIEDLKESRANLSG